MTIELLPTTTVVTFVIVAQITHSAFNSILTTSCSMLPFASCTEDVCASINQFTARYFH